MTAAITGPAAISGPVMRASYRQLQIVLPIWRDESSSSRSADHGIAFGMKTSITIIPEQLRIAVPDELTEAWTRLDLFPEVSVRQIETLRRLLPALQNEMEKFAAEKWTVEWVLPRFSIDLPGVPTYRHPVPSNYLVLYSKRCDIVRKSCDLLVKELSSTIENLRK